MPVVVYSGCLQGIEGVGVAVEVDILSQLPCFQVVGLPHSSVREARERVRSAIGSAGLDFPRRRITVNLAPADRPKHGTGLDLPIALGVVAAAWAKAKGELPWDDPPFAVGELGLDGSVRPVRGVLPLVEAAARDGRRSVVVPRANGTEAALVPGIDVLPVDSLGEAWLAATGEVRAPPLPRCRPTETLQEPDLRDVRGLTEGRRALEIAAAGGHGLLLEGPPGSGKSMLAKRLAGLLPDLEDHLALDVTRIRSAAGLLRAHDQLVRRPPLRAPHHSASVAAVVGGGRPISAGEITLAHGGVLLLDEAPEFPRSVLESLRQPLQDGSVRVARAEQWVVFPARFQLVATRNPCPCGFLGGDQGPCRCLPSDRDRYERRLSGPLLDRIDLVSWVEPASPRHLLAPADGEDSVTVRARVAEARAIQRERARGLVRLSPRNDIDRSGVPLNATAPMEPLLAGYDRAARRELEAGLQRLRGSARSVHQLVRVARTIGDLAGSGLVRPAHVEEALLHCVRPAAR